MSIRTIEDYKGNCEHPFEDTASHEYNIEGLRIHTYSNFTARVRPAVVNVRKY